MKHIFVINPAAGKTNVTEALLPRLHALFVGREEELETYLTTGVGDATRFVKERCAASNGEHLRFYSCGGDGTMNEVLQGLAGCANAAMGVVPCGSGNDFVRSFPDCDFSNLEAQITADNAPSISSTSIISGRPISAARASIPMYAKTWPATSAFRLLPAAARTFSLSSPLSSAPWASRHILYWMTAGYWMRIFSSW